MTEKYIRVDKQAEKKKDFIRSSFFSTYSAEASRSSKSKGLFVCGRDWRLFLDPTA